MKKITCIILLLCLIVFSCTLQKASRSIELFEARDAATSFKDTLIKNGIDTILLFYKGCEGCIKGAKKTAYVFWKEGDNNGTIRKFDSYAGLGKDIIINDLSQYFFAHEREIREQKLAEVDYMLEGRSRTTDIYLYVNGSLFYEKELSFQDFYINNTLNEEMRLFRWIYQIESEIFNIERHRSFY